MNFYLFVPVSGQGPTHLSPETGGILCADARYRYSTFRIAADVPARTSSGEATATCVGCMAVADTR